jgi:DNA repair protein RecN (Recombination protein N)
MLRELSVQNLALIEDVRVELQGGFCAWTGETGAGKSLLLGALGLLLGERGSTELIRSGAEELRAAGRFDLDGDDLRKEAETLLAMTLPESEVILARRLSRSGRSHAYVNDQPVAVNTLRQLGALLVDIHGQRESQSLLQPAYQLQLLDAYGNLETARDKYLHQAERVRELRRRQARLATDRQQRQRELALVQFERDELDHAQLRAGEMAKLVQDHDRLANAQALQTFASTACGLLHDDDASAVERLGLLQRQAAAWVKLDADLEEVVRRLEGLRSEVLDLAGTLRHLGQRWEGDPERQGEVEQRLQVLRRLEAKYRRPIDELIAYRATLDEQEERLQHEEGEVETIEEEIRKAFGDLREAAVELSRQRQKVARRLASQTQKELADLGMAEAKLGAVLERIPLGDDPLTAEVPAWGMDQLELTLAANPGEPALPLRKVASGGELSRTMLALKTVLAAHDRLGTLVFDEIDANVGGRLGDVLGQKLAALGRSRQVICVTHLPQVASYAEHHWTIRKLRRGSRTITQIHLLADDQRLEELASMIRGEARGETTRQEAAAMLSAARRNHAHKR